MHSSNRSAGASGYRGAGGWLIGAVWVLLAYAAWARGGTHFALQKALPWLGLSVLFCLLAASVQRGQRRDDSPATRALPGTLLRDPVLYLGLAFLLLLVLQWWNSGRVRIFDLETSRWTYAPPPRPGWPSAITTGEAAEMLRWFFPAWCLLVTLRSGIFSRTATCRLLRAVLVSAAALAALGVAVYASGSQRIFWISPAQGHFFASFGYANHAGAFFVLCLGLSLGMVTDEFLRLRSRRKHVGRLIILLSITILLLAGANLSLSGAGIALSWGLVLFAVVYGVYWVWELLRVGARVNLIVGCAALLCLGFFFVSGFGQRAFDAETAQLESKSPEWEIGQRLHQARAAVDIWRDAPWFGVGGWGYRYLFPSYVDDAFWESLSSLNPESQAIAKTGKANVHNDPLQFLAEFGVVGGGLMALVVICLLVRIGACGWEEIRRPGMLCPLVGAALTLLHSLVDLPFRSPAVLYLWLTVLACLPILSHKRAAETEQRPFTEEGIEAEHQRHVGSDMLPAHQPGQ
jgi:O-antigen ligase